MYGYGDLTKSPIMVTSNIFNVKEEYWTILMTQNNSYLYRDTVQMQQQQKLNFIVGTVEHPTPGKRTPYKNILQLYVELK